MANRSIILKALDPTIRRRILDDLPRALRHVLRGWTDVKLRTVTPVEQISNLQQTLTTLSKLAGQDIELVAAEDFSSEAGLASVASTARVAELAKLLSAHGSDKADPHGYHLVYQAILDSLNGPQTPFVLAEIGLGTNNLDTASNMGVYGKPGASLRAWREFTDNADISGADIDRRILFQETRIQTYFVNQMDIDTLHEFFRQLPKMNLLIDDGLHTFTANLQTLFAAVEHIADDGWIVVEDITDDSLSRAVWDVAASLLGSRFKCWLVRCNLALLFVAKKL